MKLNIKRKSPLQKLQIAVYQAFSLFLFSTGHTLICRGACTRNERERQTERERDRCSPLQSQLFGVKIKRVFPGIPFISSFLTFPLPLLFFSVNLQHLLLLFGVDGHLAAVCGLDGFISNLFNLSCNFHKNTNNRTIML